MKKTFKKIYVEITNACNLNCSFCNNNKRDKKYMSVDEFNHIILEIKNYTDYIYLHVKGEPLLNPNLDSILSICDNNSINVNITTNGTLLSKNVEVLKRHKCVRQINISLHSENNKENYFEDVFNACDKLSENIYINYRLWTLIDGKIEKYSQVIVDNIITHYKVSTEIVNKIINDLNITIKKNTFISKDNLFVWPSLDLEGESDGYCHGLKDHIGILVDGTVVPCCLDGEGIVNFGNIFSTNFVEIINSEKFITMKNNFMNNICLEKLCKKCKFKERFKKRED